MATLNRTRAGLRNQKKSSSFAHASLGVADVLASGDIAELFEIPENSFIKSIELNVKTAFNAGTSIVIVGALGGATIFASISIATTGVKALTVTKRDSGAGAKLTITNTTVGAVPTVGEADLIVEYVEYAKNNGEMTDYSTT